MSERESKKPDYNLSALSKENDTCKGRVGVAWRKSDGTISIKLNPFVVLDSFRDMVLTLFPVDENDLKREKTSTSTFTSPF